ncbi:hypothetical protein GGQ06_003007 [Salinibacter ruber]|nr:hypothetical protein [Salinibacter ruber]
MSFDAETASSETVIIHVGEALDFRVAAQQVVSLSV